MSSHPAITLNQLSKVYSNGTVALQEINLTIAQNQFVSVVGPSGCGKSTLLRLISGLDKANSGSIELGEAHSQPELAFIFQEPALMPWLSVVENISLPLKLAGVNKCQSRAAVQEAIQLVSLNGFEHRYPRELSGGMKMRVSIARALVTHPSILLMDEPFGALDEMLRSQLNKDLLSLWQQKHWTVVFVTHNIYEAVYLSNRVIVMSPHPGRVVADIPIEAAYPRTAEFRTSPLCNEYCREISACLTKAAALISSHNRNTAIDNYRMYKRDNQPDLLLIGIWMKRLKKLASVDVIAPVVLGILALLAWDIFVRVTAIPPYLLPGPLLVLQTLISDWNQLFFSLMITLQITLVALMGAVVSGLLVAILFAQSKWIERSFCPYAVILQTTPIVAIAPLIIIWLRNNTFAALVVCALIVAFFPIVSNTTLGLNSVDHNLSNVFHLYKGSRWQNLLYLRLPSALPYFLGGLRISGGLALIGAVVAEFVAGTGGARSGIAYQILMSSYNLQIPRMFAALFMTTSLGIIIFMALTVLSDYLLRNWHESAVKRDN